MRDPDNHVLISRLTVLELPSVSGVKVRTNMITRGELRDSELGAAERLIADYAHDLRLPSRLQISAVRPEKQPVATPIQAIARNAIDEIVDVFAHRVLLFVEFT